MTGLLEILRVFCLLTAPVCIYVVWNQVASRPTYNRRGLDMLVAIAHIVAVLAVQAKHSDVVLFSVAGIHATLLVVLMWRWSIRLRGQRQSAT